MSQSTTKRGVCAEIQANINRIDELLMEIDLMRGDEWPELDAPCKAVCEAMTEIGNTVERVRGE